MYSKKINNNIITSKLSSPYTSRIDNTQHSRILISNNNNNINSTFVIPFIPQINKKLIINKSKVKKFDVYSHLNLVQKLFYYRRLFGYYSLQNNKYKQMIDKKIINQLATENKYYIKYNNAKQLSFLSKKIQFNINLLQNPINCSNAKILVCPNYSKKYQIAVKPFNPLKEFIEPEQSERITIFPYHHHFLFRGFNTVPLEIKNVLIKYHSNPLLWYHGELLKYIWRENEKTLNLTNKIISKIPFECGPIVGIHVRRTDKITEAKLYELEDYMKWVNFWFDVNEENYQNNNQISLNCTNKRMLFVAADLSILKDVVDEVKNKWGNKYKIYHGTIFQNEKQYKSREALIEILAIFRILAKCQFLVCTLSSNTCQIVYELMQTIQGDASENVHSLDYFYAEFWMGKELEAITDYEPLNISITDGILAEKGDIIAIHGITKHDGFIKGRNNLEKINCLLSILRIILNGLYNNIVFTTKVNDKILMPLILHKVHNIVKDEIA
ncbi:hypothetical protein Mgra_00005559 [Meloidogyne graminicola]|uniref:GT23 domain-containing protein n=1 Tax=Meloidogyne graminicola TaxID=189291 RepID=A0A8S9ZNG9_9BILA|nr:hypothetical protein Mgra_00005559 [Meloidogyne graminicola]